MTPDKLQELRDYYDNNSTANEMDNGTWVWPKDWTEEDIQQWRAENAADRGE